MTSATLDGVPLPAFAPIQWSLRPGARPHQQAIAVAPEDAVRLCGAAKMHASTLVIDGLEVQRLTILGETRAPAPFARAIVVSDRRWEWSRIHVLRRYNIRRRTGEQRRLAGRVEVAPVVADVAYASYSLREGTPWTAADVLNDVLTFLVGSEFRIVGRLPDVPVENLELDDPGNEAVARVMAYLPGANLFVDLDGTVIVYNSLSGGEDQFVTQSGPPLFDAPYVGRADSPLSRPSAVHVLFDREIEVRFDFKEEVDADRAETRYLENVAPVSDVTLTITEGAGVNAKTRTVDQGTWATFDALFDAWAADPATFTYNSFSHTFAPLSHRVVQKGFTAPYLLLEYGLLGDGNSSDGLSDPDFIRRVAAIYQHYRQTFRINPRWTSKARSIRAYRVAVIDPETGTRAPAPVFSDYAIVSTLRALVRAGGCLASNVRGYPTTETNINTGKTAPALATIIDQDAGIVRVAYELDPTGLAARIIPSALDKLPQANPQAGAGTGSTSIRTATLHEQCPLEDSHRLALILTLQPAAPNDRSQLHEEVIRPNDLGGQVAGRAIGEARGPIWYLRVGAGVTTARFGWDDGKAAAIEAAFGANEASKPDDAARANIGQPVNANEVRKVAEAAAASLYASLLAHYEGSITVPLNPGLKPVGSATITHSVDASGVPLTTVDLPPVLAPLDIYALLPDSVRRTIMRMVQP